MATASASPRQFEKLHAMYARSAQSSFDGESRTAWDMAEKMRKAWGISEAEYLFNGALFYSSTDAQYILHNFRTAKARWSDPAGATHKAQEATEEEYTDEAGVRWVKVRAHTRRDRNGRTVNVKEHWRRAKAATKAKAKRTTTDDTGEKVWVNEYWRRGPDGTLHKVQGHYRTKRRG